MIPKKLPPFAPQTSSQSNSSSRKNEKKDNKKETSSHFSNKQEGHTTQQKRKNEEDHEKKKKPKKEAEKESTQISKSLSQPSQKITTTTTTTTQQKTKNEEDHEKKKKPKKEAEKESTQISKSLSQPSQKITTTTTTTTTTQQKTKNEEDHEKKKKPKKEAEKESTQISKSLFQSSQNTTITKQHDSDLKSSSDLSSYSLDSLKYYDEKILLKDTKYDNTKDLIDKFNTLIEKIESGKYDELKIKILEKKCKKLKDQIIIVINNFVSTKYKMAIIINEFIQLARVKDSELYREVINCLTKMLNGRELVGNIDIIRALTKAIWNNESESLESHYIINLLEIITSKIEVTSKYLSALNDLINAIVMAEIEGIDEDRIENIQRKIIEKLNIVETYNDTNKKAEFAFKINCAHQACYYIGKINGIEEKRFRKQLFYIFSGILEAAAIGTDIGHSVATSGVSAAFTIPKTIKSIIKSIEFFKKAIDLNENKKGEWYKHFIKLKTSIIFLIKEKPTGDEINEKLNAAIYSLCEEKEINSFFKYGIMSILTDLIEFYPNVQIKNTCLDILVYYAHQAYKKASCDNKELIGDNALMYKALSILVKLASDKNNNIDPLIQMMSNDTESTDQESFYLTYQSIKNNKKIMNKRDLMFRL